MAEGMTEKIQKLMKNPKQIRNIGIAAHIDHGKTTLSDSLLAGAGMISQELAGELMVMDFHEDEKARGITIDSANVNMIHNVDKNDYLINLIDTPGHVDFSGEVTRAMRACDGAVVLACAVEGMMPQTETVLRQALKERVRPVLFINKADRLVKELKLDGNGIQQKFIKIINSINDYILSIAPEELKDKWLVNVNDGSVCFGSAKDKWALSIPYMKKTGISFKDLQKAYEEGKIDEFSKKAPLHAATLDMVVKHLPNPIEAQKYRIPKIWHGDLESKEGKSLLSTDPKGPAVFVVTKIVVDPHAGEVAGGRLFSGTLEKGQELYMNMAKRQIRVQQVNIYKGAQRMIIDSSPAGNIVGLVGLKGVFAGETVTAYPMEPFESIKHLFEPVVTVSIDAKKPADLPKLISILKQITKEDPTIKVEINEETGENLISGMGELHLDVVSTRIKTERGVEVKTSSPIVVYRETIQKPSKEFPGRSPNKHNTFFIEVEPLEDAVYDAIKTGEIPEMRFKKKNEALWAQLNKLGVSNDEARQYRQVYKHCALLDKTRGIVHIGEVIEMIMDGFEQVINAGILAKEPCMKLKVSLMDCKLHEDAIHRGPAQVYPAIRDAIRLGMKDATPILYEPLQILQIEAPVKYLGDITKLVQSKRGQLLGVEQEEDHMSSRVKLPVAEMFGLASDLRGATEGRGTFYIVDQLFARVPTDIQTKAIKKIRSRKGLSNDSAGIVRV